MYEEFIRNVRMLQLLQPDTLHEYIDSFIKRISEISPKPDISTIPSILKLENVEITRLRFNKLTKKHPEDTAIYIMILKKDDSYTMIHRRMESSEFDFDVFGVNGHPVCMVSNVSSNEEELWHEMVNMFRNEFLRKDKDAILMHYRGR